MLIADRRRKAEQAAAWKQNAEHNDRRADAAESVVETVTREATERQASLEERIRHDAQARVDAGDPTARNRLLEKLAAEFEADRKTGRPAPVLDISTGGRRPDSAGGPKMRGRR